MKQLYRFRSLGSILGTYKELQRQTIYFAAPEQLNDPMEGVRDIFWDGDAIVWKNLFRHYLFCLERVSSLLVLCGEEHHRITADDIPVASSVACLPTRNYQELFAEIAEHFFREPALAKLIETIAQRTTPVRKNELLFYLRTIHWYCIEVIQTIYARHKMQESQPNKLDGCKRIRRLVEQGFVDCIERLLEEHSHKNNGQHVVETAMSVSEHINKQFNFMSHYQEQDAGTPNRNFVFLDFPDNYVRQLETLIYPPWYTACFMETYSNSSAWGHYADGHKGVCLIFEPEEHNGDYFIPLNGIVGGSSSKRADGSIVSSPTYGNIPLQFQPVNYEDPPTSIDFFRRLGRLTMPTLAAMWYMNGDGDDRSSCAEGILDNQETWREQYWAQFEPDLLKKTKDWAYEQEWRLILTSNLDSFANEKHRALTYDFNALKGIIFGINTPMEKKLEIMQIIADKSRQYGRSDFKFYQAYFDAAGRRIRHASLSLI